MEKWCFHLHYVLSSMNSLLNYTAIEIDEYTSKINTYTETIGVRTWDHVFVLQKIRIDVSHLHVQCHRCLQRLYNKLDADMVKLQKCMLQGFPIKKLPVIINNVEYWRIKQEEVESKLLCSINYEQKYYRLILLLESLLLETPKDMKAVAVLDHKIKYNGESIQTIISQAVNQSQNAFSAQIKYLLDNRDSILLSQSLRISEMELNTKILAIHQNIEDLVNLLESKENIPPPQNDDNDDDEQMEEDPFTYQPASSSAALSILDTIKQNVNKIVDDKMEVKLQEIKNILQTFLKEVEAISKVTDENINKISRRIAEKDMALVETLEFATTLRRQIEELLATQTAFTNQQSLREETALSGYRERISTETTQILNSMLNKFETATTAQESVNKTLFENVLKNVNETLQTLKNLTTGIQELEKNKYTAGMQTEFMTTITALKDYVSELVTIENIQENIISKIVENVTSKLQEQSSANISKTTVELIKTIDDYSKQTSETIKDLVADAKNQIRERAPIEQEAVTKKELAQKVDEPKKEESVSDSKKVSPIPPKKEELKRKRDVEEIISISEQKTDNLQTDGEEKRRRTIDDEIPTQKPPTEKEIIHQKRIQEKAKQTATDGFGTAYPLDKMTTIPITPFKPPAVQHQPPPISNVAPPIIEMTRGQLATKPKKKADTPITESQDYKNARQKSLPYQLAKPTTPRSDSVAVSANTVAKGESEHMTTEPTPPTLFEE